jgi:asparagine synthase (glutamine-hydrolysing)
MCGIVGTFDPEGNIPPVEIIKQMTQIIYHRGPDDEGMFIGPGVGLGMRRLSIIDVAGGNQPIFNEDGSLVIVFNGEIYNFQALRKQLEPKHQFTTHSDTEVVLHLYEEYGVEALDLLRGMSAFAIWDVNQQRLFIARDRLGIKPLYYTLLEGRLLFASEIKSILQCPEVPRVVNLKALNVYLSLQYVPAPDTMFQGIYKLPPGHYLTMSSQGMEIHPYWQLPNIVECTTRSEEDLANELVDRLQESVRLRLISDVPLGAFLSGGIDSSTIVALMGRMMDHPVQTFSVGFEADEAYNETHYARYVSRILGTEHHELIVDASAAGLLPRLVWHFDEPLADRAALPTYLVSRLARRYVKVALTGEGGDELFAGYRRYLALRLAQWYRRVPLPIRQGLGRVVRLVGNGTLWASRYRRLAAPDPFDVYIGQQSNFSPKAKQALLSPDLQATLDVDSPFHGRGAISDGDWLASLLQKDTTTWLPDDLLMKADKMSMAASLEARVPFLDHKLVEFVSATIPSNLRLRRLTTKYILKRAAQELLPQDIIRRRKQGFDVPLAQWVWENKEFVQDLLLSPTALSRGYFNSTFIRTRVSQALTSLDLSAEVGGQLWNLLCLELWHRLYIDRDESWLEVEDVDEYLDRQQVLLR